MLWDSSCNHDNIIMRQLAKTFGKWFGHSKSWKSEQSGLWGSLEHYSHLVGWWKWESSNWRRCNFEGPKLLKSKSLNEVERAYKIYIIDRRSYNLDGCHVWVNANSWRDSKLKGLDCSKEGSNWNPEVKSFLSLKRYFKILHIL